MAGAAGVAVVLDESGGSLTLVEPPGQPAFPVTFFLFVLLKNGFLSLTDIPSVPGTGAGGWVLMEDGAMHYYGLVLG